MEIVAGIALGVAILAFAEALVASYKASKAEEKAKDLYLTTCDSLQQRVPSLDFEVETVKKDAAIRNLDERLKALEFIKEGKKGDK